MEKTSMDLPRFKLILALFFFHGLANGGLLQGFSSVKLRPPRSIFVDPSDPNKFHTIQSAIDSISSNNPSWVYVYVKAGEYREKVSISHDKPYIYLIGEDKQTTKVVWGDCGSLLTSVTFSSFAPHVIVSDISFTNSCNYPPSVNENPVIPAVAASIAGDKTAFYNCGFYGVQDTLLDAVGRHYFYKCTIEGFMDFIFGSGQSIYEDCLIVVNGGSVGEGRTGYITAQGRSSPSETNGFVFKNCNVTGNGRELLGRAWRGYSRVIYYKCSLPDFIVPRGWYDWDQDTSQLTYAEFECYGPGAGISKRIEWEKKLTPDEVKYYTSTSFIDGDTWLPRRSRN